MRRRLVALLGLAFAAMSCGTGEPGVGIQKLAGDVVFGVPPAPPANFGAAAPVTVPPIPDNFPTPRPQPTPDLGPCPPAGLNSFPEQEASTSAFARGPAEGKYTWKRTGFVTSSGGAGRRTAIEGFEDREIRKKRVDGSVIEFETVQPDASSDQIVVTTYRVRAGRPTRSIDTVVGPPIRIGPADRGVSLLKIERFSKDRKLIADFEPDTPILLLPLPVLPGEGWSSTGYDRDSAQGMNHEARVVGRKRVDACGDIVDGWAIESTQRVSIDGAYSERKYNYVIATQLGGLLTEEVIDASTPQGSVKATFNIGQLEPGPKS